METDRARGEALFERCYPQIETTVGRVAKQKHLSADETQELYSLVMLKVVRDDYAVLRDFEGRSSWTTYFVVIAQRVLLDERIRRWGRWRPSARARRLGPIAVELERRLNRDGWTLAEASRDLLTRGIGENADRLERLAEQLPRRRSRRWLPALPHLANLADVEGADHHLEKAEHRRTARTLGRALQRALAQLPREERRLLELRYGRGWTVRRIADRERLESRSLYRRFSRILRGLRRQLESSDCDWTAVSSILGRPEVELEECLCVDLGFQRKTGPRRAAP